MLKRYCFRCGKLLEGKTAIVEVQGTEDDAEIEYDVYCSHCGWSGIVSPDRKLESD